MTCIQNYQQLLAAIDADIVRIQAMHATHLICKPRCASCCQSFSVLAIEADCLRKAIGALPLATRKLLERNLAADKDRCPLLVDDLCSIYAARPVICRTQGLPLAYVDEEREAIEVSACPLNFSDKYVFTPENLLFMDEFNTRLSELNHAWCHKQGLNPDKRIPLRELVCTAPPAT